jgi:hypothetical protein
MAVGSLGLAVTAMGVAYPLGSRLCPRPWPQVSPGTDHKPGLFYDRHPHRDLVDARVRLASLPCLTV